MRRRARASVGLGVAAVVVACAAAPPPAAPPEPREVLEYTIQPGDLIEVKIFGTPELDQQLRVRPDGHISVTPLGELKAAGLSIAALDAEISRTLWNYFEDPQVSVIVREFANRNVYVGGQVDNPGLVPLSDGMTALMAIFQAGGFRNTAQTTNVVILRDGDRRDAEVIEIDLKRVLTEALPDLVLEPFDVVFVPRSKIARVNLFVEQYIKRMLPFALVGSANYTYVDGDTAGSFESPKP